MHAPATPKTLPTQEDYYRLYRFDNAPPRRLLLLHGGGVAGKITWSGILPHLKHWNEILVPASSMTSNAPTTWPPTSCATAAAR